MYYALNEHVYLVKGHVRSCIYDFNSSKLYSVNNALSEKISMLNEGKITEDNEELNKIYEKLIKLKILMRSKSPIYRKIDEIKKADSGCDFAWIEITNKCNLKCIHCYNESNIQHNAIMPLSDYKIAVDAISKLKIKRVQIIGGEPFIDKKRLKDMLEYTIGKFDFIEIFTNGTLISEEWYEFLKKNNIHIALSVYSYEAEMHDKVTKCKGSWGKTNKTIEKLKSYGIPYRVCNVLMKNINIGDRTTNLYHLSDTKDIVRMSGRADFSLLSDELIRKKLITKKTFQKPIKECFCSRLISGHNCFKNKIYISVNMEVFPCVMERRLRHCVINENKEIVLDDSIRNLSKDRIKECSCCEYRYACFDCRPNSLSEDLWEKPWYCTYDPMVGEWKDEDEFIMRLKEKWC